MAGDGLTLRPKKHVYATVIGATVAVLALGLAIPFVFGERPADVQTRGPVRATADSTSTSLQVDPAGAGSPVTGPAAVAAAPPPGSGTASTAGAAAGAAPAQLSASDVGVTARSILIGMPDIDLSGVKQLGISAGSDLDPKAAYEAVVKDLNDRGGILGRRVEIAWAKVNPVDTATFAAACRKWTEDDHVFAVIAAVGFFGPPVRCITEEHRTPFLSADGQDAAFYAAANGLLFTTGQGKTRIMRNFGHWLDREGHLKGATIGVIAADGFDRVPVDEGLLPTLAQLGYKVARREYVSQTDTSIVPGQIAVAVQNMRAAGVDLVIGASNLLYQALFVQQAESQHYFPHYVASDFAQMTTDLLGSAFPASYDGTIGVTSYRTGEQRIGRPEPDGDARCRQVLSGYIGKPVARGSADDSNVQFVCGVMQVFAAGATAAGPGLTRVGLSRGVQGLGSFSLPFAGGGSFAPGKFDASDFERSVQWHKSCTCWTPLPGSEFTRAPA